MELVHNRMSGKAFIVLDDNGGTDFLLITPEGKVKRLERSLFDRILSVQEQPPNTMLTKLQYNKYLEITDNKNMLGGFQSKSKQTESRKFEDRTI